MDAGANLGLVSGARPRVPSVNYGDLPLYSLPRREAAWFAENSFPGIISTDEDLMGVVTVDAGFLIVEPLLSAHKRLMTAQRQVIGKSTLFTEEPGLG